VGQPESVPSGQICRGQPGSWQAGYLVGRAHLRTERGFARIDVHRVPAAKESWSRLTCDLSRIPPSGHPKEERETLSATASEPPAESFSLKAPRRLVRFRLTQFFRHAKPADARVAYVAELNERAGRLSIHRRALIRAPETTLSFPGGPRLPEEVKTKPPLPFTGSAEFLRTHESTFTWGGDLAVTFPGLDPIRLAGPCFGVAICVSKGCLIRQAETSKAAASRSRVAATSTSMLSR
jgi:hypothetical protein